MQPIQPMRLSPLTTGHPVIWEIGNNRPPNSRLPFKPAFKINGKTPSDFGKALADLIKNPAVKWPHVIRFDGDVKRKPNWGPLMPQIVSRLEDVDFINRRFYDLDLSLESLFLRSSDKDENKKNKSSYDSKFYEQIFVSGFFFGVLETQLNLTHLHTPRGYELIINQDQMSNFMYGHGAQILRNLLATQFTQSIKNVLRTQGSSEVYAKTSAHKISKNLLKDWKYIYEAGQNKANEETRGFPVINLDALNDWLNRVFVTPDLVSGYGITQNFGANTLWVLESPPPKIPYRP